MNPRVRLQALNHIGVRVRVLMDLEQKYPGFNHLSFRVPSMRDTISALGDAGIEIREGPVSLGGEIAVFVRDPDLNVVELAEITSGR